MSCRGRQCGSAPKFREFANVWGMIWGHFAAAAAMSSDLIISFLLCLLFQRNTFIGVAVMMISCFLGIMYLYTMKAIAIVSSNTIFLWIKTAICMVWATFSEWLKVRYKLLRYRCAEITILVGSLNGPYITPSNVSTHKLRMNIRKKTITDSMI